MKMTNPEENINKKGIDVVQIKAKMDTLEKSEMSKSANSVEKMKCSHCDFETNSYEKQKYQWISNGLKNAQGWSIQSKLKSLIPGQSKSPVLTYTHDSKVLTQATESQVAEWLARRASGDEERDLITDDYCSRGWETDSLMVIVMTPTGEMVENLVMRGSANGVLVKKA